MIIRRKEREKKNGKTKYENKDIKYDNQKYES